MPQKNAGVALPGLPAFSLQTNSLPGSPRTAILFATPGTTCRSAMGVYEQISRAAALRFPGAAPRWCFTSGPVRRKLAAQGLPAPDPAAALKALQAEGFTRVAVMPLHLSDGMEFNELAGIVHAQRHPPGATPGLALGHALLTSEADWRRALHALLTELPATEPQRIAGASRTETNPGRIILVVHGSTDPRGSATLQTAARLCRAVDPRLILGMMLGEPDLAAVVRECQAAGVTKAWLLPCMVVAGFSARDEIAGPGESSWASALRRAGIEVVPVIKGLGEVDGIVQIWLDAVEGLLAETM